MNRLYELDLSLCMQLNRVGDYTMLVTLFRGISRLGNGIFWYSLMLVYPLIYGTQGLMASLHMLLAAVPALWIYKVLKKKTSRPRPCTLKQHIKQFGNTLDQFSFPSGHTLHAVMFTVISWFHFPGVSWLLVPFTLLVALSRPVLGLHYPSDVLAGVVIGFAVAIASIYTYIAVI